MRGGRQWGTLTCTERNASRAVNDGASGGAEFELLLLSLNKLQSEFPWHLDTGLWRAAKPTTI